MMTLTNMIEVEFCFHCYLVILIDWWQIYTFDFVSVALLHILTLYNRSIINPQNGSLTSRAVFSGIYLYALSSFFTPTDDTLNDSRITPNAV